MDPSEIPELKEWSSEAKRALQYVTFYSLDNDQENIQNYQNSKEKYILRLKDTVDRVVLMKQQSIQNLTQIADAPHKKIDRVFALPNEYVVSCLRLELGSIIISALIED